MRMSYIGLAILAAACTSAPVVKDKPAGSVAAPAAEIEAGRGMAEAQCGACHAVGRTGKSNVPQAPTFRALATQHPGDQLKAVISEGIATGHPSMPRWVFSEREVNELLAYIRSLPSS